ncbi:hypothetical_protein [Leishmania infantum]|uniref:Hypothetical_protein n=1 Tax=Leishmania infantum TaxID=5671 RepID=A0A6L0XHC6_LEIIN|nr:hypothetical_protein [Leishmania infantum]SUZ42930.1 hypothetical_protein [Leishmania infantum]
MTTSFGVWSTSVARAAARLATRPRSKLWKRSSLPARMSWHGPDLRATAHICAGASGIPLELVPLDEDAEFCAKEAQRAELKENGKADRSGIALRETELNARAVEVAQQLKDGSVASSWPPRTRHTDV